MPYELVADGKLVPLGDRKYLLSPQDLAGLEVLPELVRLGVASLEDRGPAQVAGIRGQHHAHLSQARSTGLRRRRQRANESSDRYDDGDGLLARALHRLVPRHEQPGSSSMRRFGKKRGVFLGEVSRVEGESVWLQAARRRSSRATAWSLTPAIPSEEEEGGRVYEVRSPKSEGRNGRLAELRFGRGDIDFRRVHVGDKLWKTSDPELDRRLRQSFRGRRAEVPAPDRRWRCMGWPASR